MVKFFYHKSKEFLPTKIYQFIEVKRLIIEVVGDKHVDTETGEVMYEYQGFRKANQRVLIIDSSGDYKKEKRYGRNIAHIKMRTAGRQAKLWNKLSVEARGVLASMLLFCDWETNLVCGDGMLFFADVPLTWAQIASYCKISKPTCTKIKAELENNNVIRYYVDPRANSKKIGIAINPLFALRGENFSPKLISLFNTKDKDTNVEENLYDEEVKKGEDKDAICTKQGQREDTCQS